MGHILDWSYEELAQLLDLEDDGDCAGTYNWHFSVRDGKIRVRYADGDKTFGKGTDPLWISPIELESIKKCVKECEEAARFHGVYGPMLWVSRTMLRRPYRSRYPDFKESEAVAALFDVQETRPIGETDDNHSG